VNYASWVALLRQCEEVFVLHMCWEFVCMLIEQVVDWLGGEHSAPHTGIVLPFAYYSEIISYSLMHESIVMMTVKNCFNIEELCILPAALFLRFSEYTAIISLAGIK
jgi:hypothetical protein